MERNEIKYGDLLRTDFFKNYTEEIEKKRLQEILSDKILIYFNTQEKSVKHAIHRLKNNHSTVINNFLKNNMGIDSIPKITTNYSLFGDLDSHIISHLLNLFKDIDFDRLKALKNIKPKLELKLFKAENSAAINHQRELSKYCQYDIQKIEKKIRSIKQNILEYYERNNSDFKKLFGSYSFTQIGENQWEHGKITINLFPCWLWAETTPNSDFESFITNTLSHERAHYYHHVGRDLDGFPAKYWGKICDFVIEGIAQYYSEQFAKSYTQKIPNILNDFDTFVNTLSPEEEDLEKNVYTWHKTWKTSVQVTQIALIKSRKQKNMDQFIFKEILKDEKRTYNKVQKE